MFDRRSELPDQTIKEGSFDKEDLTLSIDQSKLPISLQMKPMPLVESHRLLANR